MNVDFIYLDGRLRKVPRTRAVPVQELVDSPCVPCVGTGFSLMLDAECEACQGRGRVKVAREGDLALFFSI